MIAFVLPMERDRRPRVFTPAGGDPYNSIQSTNLIFIRTGIHYLLVHALALARLSIVLSINQHPGDLLARILPDRL